MKKISFNKLYLINGITHESVMNDFKNAQKLISVIRKERKLNRRAGAKLKNRKDSESLKCYITELKSRDELFNSDTLRYANINKFCN